jgi:hypothetical protein
VSLAVDTEEVRHHLYAVEHSGTRYELTAAVLNALAHVPALSAEVDRLYSLLRDERLRYANLSAAVRAALSAARDGEADPLAYLRLELPEDSGERCR